MSELFSNERLVDYFTMFELEITKLTENVDMNILMNQLNSTNEKSDSIPLKIDYKHKILKMYPKKLYKDKTMYELNLESIFKMLPVENVYLKRPKNKYFSLIFTNSTLFF
jgi:hypothetical protein